MAQLDFQFAEGKKTKQKIHPSLRIDMTPLVDLGFLLISFFIFTTTLSEKNAMTLIMPKDGDPTPIPESKVLTVLLGENNKAFAYEGSLEDAVQSNRIISTTYHEEDGIGKLIREKQKQLEQTKKKKEELIFLIKPTTHCTYKNVIDALDETTINGVKKYMIVDPTNEEKLFLQNK
jgi:biopolymer transport protein ExbD